MALGAAIAVEGNVDDSLASATWVEVHERMGQTTTFRIRYEVEIGSGDFDSLLDSRLDAGSTLSLLVQGESGNQCLVKGPVGAQRIHFEHGGSGSYVEVRGADSAIKMDREAKSALWTDLTDSDAVSSILGSYGFVPDVESTAAGHYEDKHALVQRESDLSFVRRLARRNGFLFWVTCDATGIETAHFKKPPVSESPSAQLAINQTPPALSLLDLRWDVERPTSVDGTQIDLNTTSDLSASLSGSPLSALGSTDLSAITGDTRSMFLAPPADDEGDLQSRATGALVETHFFIRASAETLLSVVRSPIRAHSVIEIQGAGSRHSGKYLVAAVRHTIDPISHRMELELLRNAWEPDMDVDTLEKLVDWVRHRHFGKYRGTVTDNSDSTQRGRLKVRVPAVLGDLEVWAMPCVPYAGDQVGFFFLPDAGTGVWVEFEAGDPSYPIWTGFYWADNQLPSDASDASKKVIRTTGSTFRLDDDSSEIHLSVDDAGSINIADDVVTTRDQATHTVSTSGVSSEIGGQKTELTESSFSVNDGAWEVM